MGMAAEGALQRLCFDPASRMGQADFPAESGPPDPEVRVALLVGVAPVTTWPGVLLPLLK